VSEAPFVNFYTSDFLAGTSGMTASSKGVYITLLCLMYEAEAPLQQSWETLARRCGCTLPAFRRALSALQDDGKITVSDAGIWSQKCDKHIVQRRERQSSAKAAAKTRWEKTKENQSKADATAYHPHCQPEPEPDLTIEANASMDGGAVEATDFAKQLFDRGVGFLKRHGTPEPQARAVIGRWRKTYTDTDIFDAFARCSKQGAVEPISWITAALGGKTKGKGNERSERGKSRLAAFLGGARGASGLDWGQDCDASRPLLARG
jgi:uncharacterized protein YdaU (DUF1376 family)